LRGRGLLVSKMLKINHNYEPVISIENDEIFPNGIFEWNITKIINYIEKNKGDIHISRIDVPEYHCKAFSVINEKHIDSVDVSVPIILAEINPDKYIVIDGHHRLEKAYRNGMPFIAAYKFTVDQHIPFLTSIRSYSTFFEYWN